MLEDNYYPKTVSNLFWGSTECINLVFDNLIDVTVLCKLIILITIYWKFIHAKPSKSHCSVETFQTVNDLKLKDAIRRGRISKTNNLKIFKRFIGFIRSLLQTNHQIAANKKNRIGVFFWICRRDMHEFFSLILRSSIYLHELFHVLKNTGNL